MFLPSLFFLGNLQFAEIGRSAAELGKIVKCFLKYFFRKATLEQYWNKSGELKSQR